MGKRIAALVIALVVACSCLALPAAAAPAQGEHYLFCPNCGSFQMQGVWTQHSFCPECGCYLINDWGGGGTRGGGAPRGYYTTPDTSSTGSGSGSSSGGSSSGSSSSGNKYLTGVHNTLNKVYNIINETNNTINYVINNTTYNYTYNNYTYNNEYNYYTFNNIDNSTKYYVTNYVTYSVVSVPQEGTGGSADNPVKYDNVILYYQLPDGRNSYNLTADDVFGTYFVYDVVNYDTVAEDDGTTLALYHFDGDLKDSSAHAGTATYTAGAEYNFVESSFGGALDWSASQHTLDFTLPEAIGTGDFTFEFYGTFPCYTSGLYNSSILFSEDWTQESLCTADYSSLTDKKFYANNNWSIETSTVSVDPFGDLPLNVYTSPAVSFCDDSFLRFGNTSYFNLYHKIHYVHYYYGNGKFFSPHKCHFDRVFEQNSFTNPGAYGFDYDLPSGKYWLSFVRKDGVCFAYVNGLLASSYACSYSIPDTFTFSTDKGLTIDEFRVSNTALYDGTYTPSAQPFDTNKVLVTPSSGQIGDIAVKSNVPVSQYRVGGVRPTYPSNGFVYVNLEGDTVKGVQQYQTDGWYSVDATIYANGSWQNLKDYDLSGYVMDDPEPVPTATPGPSSDPGTCAHDYQVTAEQPAACTTTGSKTYTCSLCGDIYTDTIKALGHDWQIVSQDTPAASPTPEPSAELDPSQAPVVASAAAEPAYTLYRCSRCNMEYKDYDGTGPPKPPAADDGDSWWDKLVSFVKGLFDGFGKLVSLVMDAVSGVLGLLTDFAGVLASLYGWLPASWQLILTAGFACVLLIGVIKLFF